MELLSFFIILASGLVFSELFRRLHLPYVTALILAGILIGPYFLDLMEIDGTIAFLGSIGAVFLMFIAGAEVKIESFKDIGKSIFILAMFNGLIPFMFGYGNENAKIVLFISNEGLDDKVSFNSAIALKLRSNEKLKTT